MVIPLPFCDANKKGKGKGESNYEDDGHIFYIFYPKRWDLAIPLYHFASRLVANIQYYTLLVFDHPRFHQVIKRDARGSFTHFYAFTQL